MVTFSRKNTAPQRRFNRNRVVLPSHAYKFKKGPSFRSCLQLLFLVTLSIFLFLRLQLNLYQNATTGPTRQPFDFRHPHRLVTHFTGTAIVAACQNAHEDLRHALKSWINVRDVNEIVIVDWASSTPLQYLVEEMDRMDTHHSPVIVVQVPNVTKWNKPSAYNIGFMTARNQNILRVDCDHKIDSQFLTRHRLSRSTFFTGHETLARSDDEDHLNDVLYVQKEKLLQLGGYDERLREFGGEHDDLVLRLQALGLKRNNIDYDGLGHSYHEERSHQEEICETSEVRNAEREVNQRLISQVEPWHQVSSLSTQSALPENITVHSFRHVNVQYLSVNITRRNVSPSIREMVPNQQICRKQEFVLGKVLLDHYGVSACISNVLNCKAKLEMTKAFSARKDLVVVPHPPRALLLNCVGGLLKRLRLLSSGLSFARKTGRLAFVFWPRMDNHSLTKYTSFDTLIKPEDGSWIFQDLMDNGNSLKSCKVANRSTETLFYHFREDLTRSPIVNNHANSHIFVESDVPITSDIIRHANVKSDRLTLLNFTLSDDIQSALRSLEDNGLRESFGIYIPPLPSQNRDARAIQYLTSMQHKLREQEITDQLGNIYIDSDAIFRERLLNLTARVLSLPSFRECPQDVCFKTDLTRILALTRAAEFYTPEEDSFSRFVRFLRGERTPNS